MTCDPCESSDLRVRVAVQVDGSLSDTKRVGVLSSLTGSNPVVSAGSGPLQDPDAVDAVIMKVKG
jgi:hypothetical protein